MYAFYQAHWNPHCWADTELNFFSGFFPVLTALGRQPFSNGKCYFVVMGTFFRDSETWVKEISGPSEEIALRLEATSLILKVNHDTF